MVRYEKDGYDINWGLVWYQRLEEIIDGGYWLTLGLKKLDWTLYESPTREDVAEIEDKTHFHETGTFENGMGYGILGSLEYIIGENGKVLTPGFHSIKPVWSIMPGNKFRTELGNQKYSLRIRKK